MEFAPVEPTDLVKLADEIDALAEKATPGPWTKRYCRGAMDGPIPIECDYYAIIGGDDTQTAMEDPCGNDAALAMALVNNRATITQALRSQAQALADERERCAKVVEEQAEQFKATPGIAADFARGWIAQCAAAIRALSTRKEHEPGCPARGGVGSKFGNTECACNVIRALAAEGRE